MQYRCLFHNADTCVSILPLGIIGATWSVAMILMSRLVRHVSGTTNNWKDRQPNSTPLLWTVPGTGLGLPKRVETPHFPPIKRTSTMIDTPGMHTNYTYSLPHMKNDEKLYLICMVKEKHYAL